MNVPAHQSETALLNKLLAGQAQTEQRFEELFRRLARAEGTAGEARDIAKELVTVLREQDVGSRIVELRTELRAGQAELRQDFVAANNRLRNDLEAESEARKIGIGGVCTRINALEADRNKVVGIAAFFSWLSKVAPWLFALLMAALAGLGLKNGVAS